MDNNLKTVKITPKIQDNSESKTQVLSPEDKLRIFVNIAIDRVLLDLKNGKLDHFVKSIQTKNG